MKKIIGLLLFPLLFLACDEKLPTPVTETKPDIIKINLPATIYLNSPENYFISVAVSDPQGITDIASVTAAISSVASGQVVQTIVLKDDGQAGDILPNDGLFHAKIEPALAETAGNYTFTIKVSDLSENTVSQISDAVAFVAGAKNLAPQISAPKVPEIIDLNATGEYIISVSAADADGLNDIQSVLCQIFSPFAPQIPNRVDTLRDAGTNGDTAPGDGIFSTKISGAFARKRVGAYSFRFQAMDRQSQLSNPLVEVVQVMNAENLPPQILSVTAPDTLVLHATNVIVTTLLVEVTDPQGLGDIRSVFFNSFLPPDNRPSSQNPFYMNDDGKKNVSGDVIAGDGVYSLTINLPPNTPPGNYTWIFETVDLSGAASDQIPHVVTVKKN